MKNLELSLLIVGSLILLATLIIKLFSYMNWNLKDVKELFIRCRGRPEVAKEEPLPLLSELMIDSKRIANEIFDNKDRRLDERKKMNVEQTDRKTEILTEMITACGNAQIALVSCEIQAKKILNTTDKVFN